MSALYFTFWYFKTNSSQSLAALKYLSALLLISLSILFKFLFPVSLDFVVVSTQLSSFAIATKEEAHSSVTRYQQVLLLTWL